MSSTRQSDNKQVVKVTFDSDEVMESKPPKYHVSILFANGESEKRGMSKQAILTQYGQYLVQTKIPDSFRTDSSFNLFKPKQENQQQESSSAKDPEKSSSFGKKA